MGDDDFGMKAHVGMDLNGLVHTLVTTHAGASEFKQLPQLLHGQERELYADQACWSEFHRLAARDSGGLPGKPATEPGPTAECSRR